MKLNALRARAVGASPLNAGIRLRLAAGFGIVLVCLAVITGLAYWRLTTTVHSVQRTAATQAALAEVTRKMAQMINDAQVALISTSVVTQAEDVAAQRDAATQALKAYDAAKAELEALLRANPALGALQQPAKQLADEEGETRGLLNAMWDRIGDPAQREMVGSWIAFTAQPGFVIWMKRLVEFDARRKALAEADTAAVEADAYWARTGLLLFAGVALLAGLMAGWQISQGIVRPIREAVAVADRVAQGDLSNDIDTHRGGEAGLLMAALSRMQNGLRELVQSVKLTSSGIAVSSGEVAAGSDDLSQRTEQTAAELQRTAATMSEFSEAVQHTAEAARQASVLAGVTSQAVERGSAAIASVAHSMGSINAASNQIAEITGVIDGIAFQTNILALNAAVEAARAGEQGRGFAVVASEVRALAQRSAEAAKAIKGLIAGNVEAVRRGDQQVSGTVREMNDILVGVRQVSETIASITCEADTQSQQVGMVNAAVTRLDAMTQQNAAMVEQSSAAARSLSDEAARLQALVQSFRFDDAHAS